MSLAQCTASWSSGRSQRTVAYQMMKLAIARGELVRQPCEECGRENTHGHHDDYLKPLEVRWLCPSHHRRWHLLNGQGANADARDDRPPIQRRRNPNQARHACGICRKSWHNRRTCPMRQTPGAAAAESARTGS